MTASQRAWTEAATREYVEECLAAGMHAVYQPIVDLATGRPVALEALARPPAGSRFDSPGPLFVAAKRVGLHAELDLACRRAALDGAAAAGLPAGTGLFVNVEPDVLAATPAAELPALFEQRVPPGVCVVLEVTERALTDRAPALFAALDAARAAGRCIALDDVGANPDGLALLPFVRPDVVRVDGSLIQAPPGRKTGYVGAAVRAYAERTGAHVLAECIENENHLEHALALGATLGQGWMFGRPGPIPDLAPIAGPIEPVATRAPGPPSSPFAIVRDAGVVPRAGPATLLRLIAQRLTADALADPGRPVILGVNQRYAELPPEVRERFAELVRRCPFVAMFAVGMPPAPVPGVHGVSTPADDPLADEFGLVVAGPRGGAVMVARLLGDGECEYAVSHQPAVVHAAADCLMQRV